MCRHLGYLGPTRSVREVIAAGEFSLLRQSWSPRDMRGGGTINADGSFSISLDPGKAYFLGFYSDTTFKFAYAYSTSGQDSLPLNNGL